MEWALNVDFHNDLVGQLIQDDGGQMVFDYAESWLNKPAATPLSQFTNLR
jgi:HipA-like protein